MKLNDLKPNVGSTKRRTRVGRGISAGQGKTSGRGTKGQGARRRGTKAPYFEGGQLPLVRRLPFKRGFTNLFRIIYQEVSVEKIGLAFPKGGEVNPATLFAKKLIHDAEKPVVVLGNGELTVKVTVSAHRFTGSAKTKIEAAGGTVDQLQLVVKGARATVKLIKRSERLKLAAEQNKSK
jgi:large subunit ribosomal protein L15